MAGSPVRSCSSDHLLRKKRQRVPDQEIERGAENERGLVQICQLVPQDLVVLDQVGVRPFVQMVHPEDDWEEQHRHDRNNAGGGAQLLSDDHAPRPARQLMDHHQSEAAERQSEDQEIGHQIRLVELR